MTRHFKDWRTEIDGLDAEIIRLCERRVLLATEMLKRLRSELSLGEFSHDVDRLMLLLYGSGDSLLLDPKMVAELFRLLTKECGRAAEQAVRANKSNGGGVIPKNDRVHLIARLLSDL